MRRAWLRKFARSWSRKAEGTAAGQVPTRIWCRIGSIPCRNAARRRWSQSMPCSARVTKRSLSESPAQACAAQRSSSASGALPGPAKVPPTKLTAVDGAERPNALSRPQPPRRPWRVQPDNAPTLATQLKSAGLAMIQPGAVSEATKALKSRQSRSAFVHVDGVVVDPLAV